MRKIILAMLFYSLFYSQVNAMGLIFTNATHPLTATCVKSGCANMKCGEASSINLLGIIDIGDGGIDAAAKNGCVNIINYVDVSEKSFLILFRQLTTTVYGY